MVYRNRRLQCRKEKKSNADVLLTTGADTSFSLMNIYDIAGNVYEWTLENSPDNQLPCTFRGGLYYNGVLDPASYRWNGKTYASIEFLGFRVSLY